jgi:urate oxidase
MLESDMEHAFVTPSNKGMTPTDTVKNTVYYIAKQFSDPCSPEEFAVALAKHFVNTYPLVHKAKVVVEAANWRRLGANGPQPHEHGFVGEGSEVRTAHVTHSVTEGTVVTGGITGLKVLKTTQSGYAGFLADKFTTLPDVDDRIVATVVTANWRWGDQGTILRQNFAM